MRLLPLAAFLCLACEAAGCGAPAPAPREAAPPVAGRPELTVTRTGPVDMDLQWKHQTPDVAAYLVEFTTKPRGPYTILAALSPDVHTFRHTKLVPQMPFTYRVRALHGRPSNVVRVTTGKMPETVPPHTPRRMPNPVMLPNDTDTPPPRPAPVERSVRDPRTAQAAAPTDLTATLVTPVNVLLRWKDNAQDEEGYILEASKEPSQAFSVVGLFPPDTTEFEIPNPLPAETTISYRVRAYFSNASNRVVQTTGRDPDLPRAASRPGLR